jgi:hypothetical protein
VNQPTIPSSVPESVTTSLRVMGLPEGRHLSAAGSLRWQPPPGRLGRHLAETTMTIFLQIATRRLAMVGGFAVGLAIMALFAPPAVLEFDRADLPAESASPGRADRLAERHGCWSGAAPVDMEGKLPGHVVVSIANGRTVYSSALVGRALDQAFGGRDRGLLVHAFCR